MKWEVSGADRQSGVDRVVTIEADTEDSARRRGARAGLMVSDVRPIDADDSVHSQRVIAQRPPIAAPSDPPLRPAVMLQGVGSVNVTTPFGPLTNGWGIGGVVVGIVAFVLAFVPCLGLMGAVPLGVIAMLLSIVGLIIGYSYGRPVITSWIGAGSGLAAIILAVVITSALAGGMSRAVEQAQASVKRIEAENEARQAAANAAASRSSAASSSASPSAGDVVATDDLSVAFVSIVKADFGQRITLRFTNKTGRRIDSIKGGVDALDQFGDDILRYSNLGIARDEPLAVGESFDEGGIWPMASGRLADLLQKSPTKVSFKWKTDKVKFTD